MNEQRPARPSQSPSGPTDRVISLAGFILVLILGGGLLNLLLALLSLCFLWPQEGAGHALQMALSEQTALEQDLRLHPLRAQAVALLDSDREILRHAGENLFTLLRRCGGNVSLNPMSHPVITTLRYSLECVMTRLLRLMFALPLFLLCMTAGLVEGLVLRDLRRFGAGYESTLTLNGLARLSGKLLKYIMIIYIANPGISAPLNTHFLLCSSLVVMLYFLLSGVNIRARL